MTAIQDFAYIMVGSLPLFGVIGLISYICLLITGMIMILNRKTKMRIPVKFHVGMARLTIALATVHAFLALSIYVF